MMGHSPVDIFVKSMFSVEYLIAQVLDVSSSSDGGVGYTEAFKDNCRNTVLSGVLKLSFKPSVANGSGVVLSS